MALSGDQVRRYARHVLLPDVGGVGQARLLAATVVVDGADRAATVALDYLAAAGVGTIAVAGAPDRVPGLAARAAALNPDVRVVAAGADHAGAPALDLGDGPALEPVPGADLADDLVRAGAATAALLHRLATAA